MSFLNWFSGKSGSGVEAQTAQPLHSDRSGPSRERARSASDSREKPPVPAPQKSESVAPVGRSSQKSHRHAKRELLYAAVREAMIRAGVLSASYKFKVLSLDPRGEQFMVMMDVSQDFSGQAERLAEIEVMIAQGAKSRYNIRVTAVYWRMNEMVSVGRASSGAHAISRPAPLVAHPVQAADGALAAQAAALPAAAAALKPAPARYEPIQADEVAAFKQALAAASAQGSGSPDAHAPRSGPRSYTLLTGFEDTEMPDAPALVPALSATQYGDLN